MYLHEQREYHPFWSSRFVFWSTYPCLFSSQVPFLFTSDSSLKFVEVHHEFLRHQWLHDITLGDWNCLTTWPLSRVFSRVLKRAELVEVACFGNIIPRTRMKKTFFAAPITRRTRTKSIVTKGKTQESFFFLPKQNSSWNARGQFVDSC